MNVRNIFKVISWSSGDQTYNVKINKVAHEVAIASEDAWDEGRFESLDAADRGVIKEMWDDYLKDNERIALEDMCYLIEEWKPNNDEVSKIKEIVLSIADAERNKEPSKSEEQELSNEQKQLSPDKSDKEEDDEVDEDDFVQYQDPRSLKESTPIKSKAIGSTAKNSTAFSFSNFWEKISFWKKTKRRREY